LGKTKNMVDSLREKLGELIGKTIEGMIVKSSGEFSYTDPVDGSKSPAQGIRIEFEGGARAVFRLSGTGTQGATIRLYLEQVQTDPHRLQDGPVDVLENVRKAALTVSNLVAVTGRNAPDVCT
jgi:phosphoglucomutase